MIRYKLTDENGKTQNNTTWGDGKEYRTKGGGDLCTDKWLHCYSHPLLAVLLNPIHADFKNPKMCKVECSGKEKTDGLKWGYTRMKFVRWIDVPIISENQKIAFGILCAKQIYKNKDWNKWANNWLKNKDRTVIAANLAATYATAIAATYAAAYAICAAYAAARAAACTTADAAARDKTNIDFILIAKKAMKY